MTTMKTKPDTPILLAILDGWGMGPPSASNAIHMARTPNMDRWLKEYPHTTLVAHNGMVGLPEGQMGNSEVGHLNIGAGRIVYQDFTRINRAIESGEFFENPVLTGTMAQTARAKGSVHLLGLVSDGGVHSHINHLAALVRIAKASKTQLFIHAFTDGRDTPPQSGKGFIADLVRVLQEGQWGRVATISGRYYAMDRDKRWDRVELAWKALVDGQGTFASAEDPVAAVTAAYARGETDEFITPTVLCSRDNRPVTQIADGDSVIFFNFRADRARQLTHAFLDASFDGFSRAAVPRLHSYVTMTRYDKTFTLPVAFPPQTLTHLLGEEISGHGLTQLRIAETEKYAHVTYFFNGGREEPFPGEERILVPSPREVATYDKKPAMSAPEVTERLLARLEKNPPDFIVLNFANGDMVGHTGIMAAAVAACETVDRCLGRLVEKIRALGGVVLITSDHGNAEMMTSPDNGAHTAHTSNPVPFLLLSERCKGTRLAPDGALKDIAPTVLSLAGIPVPKEMEGKCLIPPGPGEASEPSHFDKKNGLENGERPT